MPTGDPVAFPYICSRCNATHTTGYCSAFTVTNTACAPAGMTYTIPLNAIGGANADNPYAHLQGVGTTTTLPAPIPLVSHPPAEWQLKHLAQQAPLCDNDIERIARRVAELMKEAK